MAAAASARLSADGSSSTAIKAGGGAIAARRTNLGESTEPQTAHPDDLVAQQRDQGIEQRVGIDRRRPGGALRAGEDADALADATRTTGSASFSERTRAVTAALASTASEKTPGIASAAAAQDIAVRVRERSEQCRHRRFLSFRPEPPQVANRRDAFAGISRFEHLEGTLNSSIVEVAVSPPDAR